MRNPLRKTVVDTPVCVIKNQVPAGERTYIGIAAVRAAEALRPGDRVCIDAGTGTVRKVRRRRVWRWQA